MSIDFNYCELCMLHLALTGDLDKELIEMRKDVHDSLLDRIDRAISMIEIMRGEQ